MTLVHITTVPQTLGFILRQILFMRAHGWDVHTIASPGRYAATLEENSIKLHPVQMTRRITPFRDLVAIARLWRHIRRLAPAVVHAHTPKAGLLGMIAATLARVPVRVFHVHGLPHQVAKGLRHSLLVWSTRVACHLAHRVFCVSPSIRRVLIAEHLCPPKKVMVPANGSSGGIEAEQVFNPAHFDRDATLAVRTQYGIPPEAKLAAFIGRVVRDKGVIELAAAWQDLAARFPDLHLLIVGDFEPQDPVPPEVIAQLRNHPRVHIAGFCNDMPALYAALDIVIFPTYREGFPNVPLEAAAMQVPIVASAVDGCVDAVVDGVTGTLVPPYDAAALGAAVERYLLDPGLCRRHGQAGRERALTAFHSEPIWRFVKDSYSELLEERGMRLASPPQHRLDETLARS